jgi:hypothetical protein
MITMGNWRHAAFPCVVPSLSLSDPHAEQQLPSCGYSRRPYVLKPLEVSLCCMGYRFVHAQAISGRPFQAKLAGGSFIIYLGNLVATHPLFGAAVNWTGDEDV